VSDLPTRTPIESFMHRVEGIDWYCQQQGAGPTIVLVPSGEGDCTSFDPVAAQLADRFSILTFDMPGFSRTSAPPDPRDLTPVKAADQVAALVRSLGIDKASFYGCSSGGAVVLLLIAGHPDIVTNGIVHEVAINTDYRSGKSQSLLPSLCALTDDEIVEQCKVIFRELMNDDPAAWDALGQDYHARLERNYVTWVRSYVNYSGPGPAYQAADFTNRPLEWTIGGLTPAMTFFSNVRIAASLGILLNLLPCKHFPQVSIPDLLTDHIRRSARAIWPDQRASSPPSGESRKEP
jgi:pimeloyl-ACP methyl ester carboxylesterase